MTLYIREQFTNETENRLIGISEWYEPFTDNRKRIFREMQREYGRCVSAMYIDGPTGETRKIGWYFERKEQYEDTGRYGRPAEYYIRGVWVELHDTDEERERFAGHLATFDSTPLFA